MCLRADAGVNIGYGHFIRTLALADMLKDGYDCVFYTTAPTPYQIEEMSKVCHYVALQEDTKLEEFINSLKGDEIVVLDNYFFTTDYQRQIKDKGSKLVCIDDMHDKHYVADAVINHTPGTKEEQFSKENYTRLYLGPEYLLLRKQFRDATYRYTPFENKKNVYICYGGSDELNLTRKACEVILYNQKCHIDAVVGGAYEYYEDLKNYAKDKDITVYRNASPDEIVELLRNSCLAIVPDSMVFFETCCLRRPCITGFDCDNQMFIADYNKKHNMGYEIGNLLDNYEEKLTKAYRDIDNYGAMAYIENQRALINDTAKNILNIFKSFS